MRVLHALLFLLSVLVCASSAQVKHIVSAQAQPLDEKQIIVQFNLADSTKLQKVNIVFGGKTEEVLIAGKRRIYTKEITYTKSSNPDNKPGDRTLYLDVYDENGERVENMQLTISSEAISNSTPVAATANDNGLFVGKPSVSPKPRMPAAKGDPLQFKLRSTGEPVYVMEVMPDFDMPPNEDLFYIIERTVDGKTLDNIVRKVERVQAKGKVVDKPLNPQKFPVLLEKGFNEIKVSVYEDEDGKVLFKQYIASTTVQCDAPCEVVHGRSTNTRAIVGFEQAGGSGTTGKVTPFLNFFLNVPLFVKDVPKGSPPRFSIWTDFRLSSSPSQRFLDLSQFTTNYLTPGSNFSENQVVQNFRINSGIDVRIFKQTAIFPFFEPARSSLSIIAGGGITAPLDANNGPIAEIFKIPRVDKTNTSSAITPEFKTFFEGIRNDLLENDIVLPDLEDSKVNIAFSKSERVRFYKRLFAGFRLKSHFAESIAKEKDLSPATFDVTFGIDELVSNRFRNGVLSFEGFSPFPIGGNDYIYIYGGGSLRLTRKANSFTPIFLERGNIEDLESATTIVVPGDKSPFGRAPRDIYFFGIGFDFLKLFRRERTIPDAAQ